MESSSDQKLIYDTWSHTDHNLLIQAVAGSGKTTSLMGILALCEYRTLFLAFNKSIQEEITGRIESAGYSHAKAMTLHSLGLSAIRGSKKVTISNGKNYDIIKNLQNYNKRLFSRMSWEEKVKTSMTLMDMNDVSRIYLTDDLEEIYKFMEIMDKFSFKPDNIDSLWTEFLNIRAELDRGGIIDFLDMIYLPVKHKLYIPVQPYYLMIDEAQDLSVVQHAFVDQFIAQGDIKKWVAVGDRRQCQPKGTKVLMKDLSEKNIEDLIIGDEVVSYHKTKCQFVGTGKSWNAKAIKVLDIKSSTRVDNLFTFKLESGHQSSYTSNHKCYVQLSDERMKGKYVVYMMRKGVNFRLGISPCNSASKAFTFGPITRALSEGADDLWILRTFNSREEAYLHEQILSYQFKIPQLRFKDKSGSERGMSQKHLDLFWHEFKDQHRSAQNILKWFFRELAHPFWSNTNNSQGGVGNSWKVSSHSMFKTQACNILPDIMDMCIFDKTNIDIKGRINRTMIPIANYEIKSTLETFISLDIEVNHNYVADGILTSNSIYGFSGSYSESFDSFKDKGNVVELPLDVCYRCPQLIIDEANDVYDVMTGFKEEMGIVDYLSDFEEIQPGSMIICRNSGPLLDAYFQLLSKGMKVFIKGEDILGSINRFLKPYSYDSISRAGTKMSVDIIRLKEKETKSDEERYKLYKMQENYKNFVLLSKYYASPGDKVSTVIQSLQDMFQESNDSEVVTLCTIHKSKGLESDVVYILNENLIPSKFAKSKTQLEQEQNLKYVARTRSKKELYYLTIKSNSEE